VSSSQLANGLSIWQWYKSAIKQAKIANVSLSELDWLIREITGIDSLALRLDSYKNLSNVPLKLSLLELDELWHQSLDNSLPVQYIAQSTPWRDLILKVTPAVLIPRPETELLIDLLENLEKEQSFLNQGVWVDLGTGSGAIAIAVARLFVKAKVYAVDLSNEALKVARENVTQYNLGENIQLVQGSWWDSLSFLTDSVTGMISNPPYIPTSLIEELDANVKNHEPHLALDGGIDGLQAIRTLINTSPRYLISGGIWFIEIMIGQAQTVAKLLQENGNYQEVELLKDLSGIDRFVLARRI
jgi:release factor glutamine methyltransferase